MYIDINSFANFFKGIGGSISVSAIAFWNDVLVPLWVNFTGWIESFLPWCKTFAQWLTSLSTTLFKWRYMSRIYSFALLLPIFGIFLVLFMFKRIFRRRRKRKKLK